MIKRVGKVVPELQKIVPLKRPKQHILGYREVSMEKSIEEGKIRHYVSFGFHED